MSILNDLNEAVCETDPSDERVRRRLKVATSPIWAPYIEYFWYLRGLVKVLRPSYIMDIGTFKGHSAAVFSDAVRDFGLAARIDSFDIERHDGFEEAPGVTYHLTDLIGTQDTPFHIEGLKPNLVFLDVDPHDGIKERHFLNYFNQYVAPRHPMICVFDDIHLNPGMDDFWSSMKYNKAWITKDITGSVPRSSGMGLGLFIGGE